MSLEKLRNILPPPKGMARKVPIDWEAIKIKYNINAPRDFKELISTYGSGVIDSFVWILDPTSSNVNVNFEKSKYFISSYALLKKDYPEDYPRPQYPEPGSFFPWAVTDNGETFVWIVEGRPDDWYIAIHSVDQGEEEIYQLSTVEFLARLLKREVKSKILPKQFPTQKPTFSMA